MYSLCKSTTHRAIICDTSHPNLDSRDCWSTIFQDYPSFIWKCVSLYPSYGNNLLHTCRETFVFNILSTVISASLLWIRQDSVSLTNFFEFLFLFFLFTIRCVCVAIYKILFTKVKINLFLTIKYVMV